MIEERTEEILSYPPSAQVKKPRATKPVNKVTPPNLDEVFSGVTSNEMIEMLERPFFAIFETLPERLFHHARSLVENLTGRQICELTVQAFQYVYTKASAQRLTNWKMTYVYKDVLRIMNAFEIVTISKYTPTFQMILLDCSEDSIVDEGIVFDPKEYAEIAFDTIQSLKPVNQGDP